MSIAYDVRPLRPPAGRTCPAPAAVPVRRPCVIIEFPPPVTAPRSRPARHPVRLTRRGRRLAASALGAVGMGAVVAGLVGLAGVGAHALSGGAAPDTAVPRTSPPAVVVRAGDSLWSIAHAIAPDADPRAVVASLRARNHLVTGAVRPGQRLVVPRPAP